MSVDAKIRADGYCTVLKDLGNIPHENSLLKVFL
jgi:hypothetical protein